MKKGILLLLVLLIASSLAFAKGQEDSNIDDWTYIQDKGEMIVGITIFPPMNYYDDDGKLIGFETEFAQAVCEILGVEANFVEINWDTKEIELAAKNIDSIWNGMTVTPERQEKVLFSTSYIRNMQVTVVKKSNADKFSAKEALNSITIAAEVGSAGEDVAKDQVSGATVVSVAKQTDALLEVKAGTADAAILDYTLATAMTGAGADYSDLVIAEGLYFAIEEYAVAFRLGSTVVTLVNDAIAQLVADGTLNRIAAKYDLEDQLLFNQ